MSNQDYTADQMESGIVGSGLTGRRNAKTGPSLYQRYGKRALDLGLTLMSLPASVPLIGAVALLVMLDGARCREGARGLSGEGPRDAGLLGREFQAGE